MNDDLSPKARAFLRDVHHGDDPSSEDFDRVHDALRARLVIGVAAGAASLLTSKAAPAAAAPTLAVAAPTTLVAAGIGATLTTKIVAAVLVVGALAGGTTAVIRSGRSATEGNAAVQVAVTETGKRAASAPASAPASASASASASAPAPAPAPASASASAPETASETASETETAAEGANKAMGAARVGIVAQVARPKAVSAPGEVVAAPVVPALDAEIAILRDARAALRSGDGGRALALLDQHDSRFPGGMLAEDSAAERIFALCALGRTGQAGALAAAFLASHPSSPYAATVRASCGGGSK